MFLPQLQFFTRALLVCFALSPLRHAAGISWFIHRFYERLFAALPEAKKFFKVGIVQQVSRTYAAVL